MTDADIMILSELKGNKQNVMESLKHQVGGDHYKKMAVQPIEYITKNGLDFNQGCIVKYISRYRDKNGAEDIEKIIQVAKIILQLEYGYTDEQIKGI